MHPADDQSSMEMGYQDQGYTGTDISTPGSLPFQSPMMDVIGGIKVIPSDSNSSRKRIGVACVSRLLYFPSCRYQADLL